MHDAPLAAALAALSSAADHPSTLHEPFLRLFPVSGVTVSTVGELLGSETIAASDDVAARIDELQFDLGEGPCWDAISSGKPILEPDLRGTQRMLWPAFTAALADQPVSSLFAFPLIVGALRIGAVDLYSEKKVDLTKEQTLQATTLADVVGQHVLRRALNESDADFEAVSNPFSRRVVHQATGMLIAQLRIPSDHAALIIQGHAFATNRLMMDVAQSILDRKLRFYTGANGIEASE